MLRLMKKDNLLFLVIVVALSLSGAAAIKADDYEPVTKITSKDVNKTTEQARKIKVQQPKVDKSYMDRAAQINKDFNSPETQAELNKYKDQAKRILGLNKGGNSSSQTMKNPSVEKKGVLLPTEKVFVFISESVPLSTLRSYASDIDNSGEENVVMVMRGFVGGMKKIKPTMNFISRIISKDSTCDLMSTKSEKCKVYNVNVMIDPTVFERFGITAVPAVVFADGITTGTDVSQNMSEGNPEAFSIKDIYTAYGDMSLAYVMDQVYSSSKNPRVAALAKILRGGYYK